jgi:hypothetical protein
VTAAVVAAPAGPVAAVGQGVLFGRLVALARWVQLHQLPVPVTVWPWSGQVLVADLAAFERWLRRVHRPLLTAYAMADRESGEVGMVVSATAEVLDSIGPLQVQVWLAAPHLVPFARRAVSWAEVLQLVRPVQAGVVV